MYEKKLCLIITMLMLFSFFSTTLNIDSAWAASTDQTNTITTTLSSDNLTISIGTVEALPNEIVTIPINFTNVPKEGIMTFSFDIHYDKTKLEYFNYEPVTFIHFPEKSTHVR